MASSTIKASSGAIIQGTKNAVTCPNNGTETQIGSITLPYGLWIVEVSGWSPLDATDNRATQISLNYTESHTVTLSMLFNLTGVYEIVNDSDTLQLKVTNWESESKTSATNYTFRAVKIA